MTKHAIERAKERYKLDLTFEDLEIIVSLVKKGSARFSYNCGNKSVYKLRYKHILIAPLLSEDLETVITFYPLAGKTPRFIDKDSLWKIRRLKGVV